MAKISREGRTPCLNPKCGRTFKQEEGVNEVVCGKCWRLLPNAVRSRYKELRRRWKLIDKLQEKGNDHRRRGRRFGRPDIGVPQWYSMNAKMNAIWERHWNRIRAFYLAPEKPVGLETFFEEMNWKGDQE